MGLYFNISIVFFYLPIVCIYFINKNLRKKQVKKLNLFNIKRYFRFFKIFLNSKVLITIFIFSVISNTITIYQNNKYNIIYKDKENLEGKALVVSEKEDKEYSYLYKIKVLNIENKKEGKNTYLYLRVNKKSDILLEYGDIISFKGEFQEPSKKRNYGGFDYKNYLKTLKIYGTIKLENGEVLEKNKGNILISFSNKISNSVKEKIYDLLNEREANLLIGLLLGDDDNIDNDIEEAFKISSLSHILAVSGMQVTYIITAMYFIFNNILGKRKTKIVIIIILIFYTILTGFSPSIVRASIMGILIMGAGLFYRKNDIWNSIAISLLLMLIYNPFLITNVGLQLSYLGTIGIILLNKTFLKMFNKIKFEKYILNRKIINIVSKIIEILTVTISASIAVFPIMLYNFNLFGTYFLITNLLASIIIGPITIFGTVIVIISFIFLKLGKMFSIFLEIFLNILVLVSNFSKLPFSKIYITTPKIFMIIFYYVLIIVFNYIYKIYHNRNLSLTQMRFRNLIALYKYKIKEIYNNKKSRKKFLSVLILIVFCFNICNFFIIKRELKIYFVDVGQGDSTFIVTPKNETILIDGGGSLGTDFDVGESTLLPYILDRGYKKIDLMFVSHFDQDHIGGLFKILEELKVEKVCISKQEEDSENYQKFLNIVKEKNIQVLVVKIGDKIVLDKNLYFDILWPKDKQIEENKLNNNAIVMKLNYNNFSMMFTGDIEKKAEEEIIETYKNSKILESDILKVAHHGSKTSTTDEFLSRVKPKIALIGVGKDNMFNHPSNTTIEKLENMGIKIYRTDLNGEISIFVDNNGKVSIKSLY